MIEHYVPSLGLKRGVRVSDYSSVEELETAAEERGACLRMANKYLVEKGSLVDARDKFAEELEKQTGFTMKTKKVVKKKSDGSTDTVEEPDETEVQFVNRFRKEVLSGQFVHPRFPQDDLENSLQNFADLLGTFPADAKRPERVAREKKPPKWVMERVEVIFANGTVSRWWETMQKEGIKIPAQSGDKEKDKLALAWAIRERQQRQELEAAKMYA